MTTVYVDSAASVRLPVLQAGINYYARVISFETQLTIDPTVQVNQKFTAPTRYYQIGQITLYDAGFVCYHSFLEFEQQSHGLYVPNRESIMPIFSYPDTSYPYGAAADKNSTPNTAYNTGPTGGQYFSKILELILSVVNLDPDNVVDETADDPIEIRDVLKTKPYYMGWMKCVDEFEVEIFNPNVTCNVFINELR